MEKELYDLMDWAAMEAIVYSEEDHPQNVLGPRAVKGGILIQCFLPGAIEVKVKVLPKGKVYPMEKEDGEYGGFFSALIPGKKVPEYVYLVTYNEGEELEIRDPYAFADVISKKDTEKFENGIHYEIYEKLGSHPMTINGVDGVLFAVWAPNAVRVSVVGDFNHWDGRIYPMKRIHGSGIFELFIPGLKQGMIYKYEIKTKNGLPMLKTDPYGFYAEKRPNNASIVWNINNYQWNDADWIEKRVKTDHKKQPMNIYEVHLGSWKKPACEPEEENEAFYNYREIAPMLADYVHKMNYTHIELMPIMEHPFDGSWGYQVTGYYAATSRYGTPDDFMYFMDYMHQKGIGVILDWVPAHFPRDAFGLATFDGTCLYEHLDPRQGSHPHWGTLIFNYGRPEVSNFLIANALFWAEKYHADGIRMDAVASMLYLDYGKNDGEWVANMYGGNENLEAIELLRHMNTVFKGRKNGAILIAEESTAWPMITGKAEDGGLNFDYKWNMGWMNDFTNYMKTDPLFRSGNQGALTFSMVYAYSENFILVLSHDEVVHGKASMIGKMPGEIEEKFANLRVAYGYMTAHPGKKLLFMGQEFAQFAEWNEAKALDWQLVEEYETHRQMQHYVSTLNKFYKDHPALYQLDHDPAGFEWIDHVDAERSIISFIRKTDKAEETLLVVCSFTPVAREEYQVGVPFHGKFKEIFNSDKEEFGGKGNVNARVKTSKEIPWNDREESITITVPPLGIIIFSCTPVEKPVKKAAAKKATAKKATAKKTTTKKAATKKEEIIEVAEAVEEQPVTEKKKAVRKPAAKKTAKVKPEVIEEVVAAEAVETAETVGEAKTVEEAKTGEVVAAEPVEEVAVAKTVEEAKTVEVVAAEPVEEIAVAEPVEEVKTTEAVETETNASKNAATQVAVEEPVVEKKKRGRKSAAKKTTETKTKKTSGTKTKKEKKTE